MIALIRDYFRRSWIPAIITCLAAFGFEMIACRVFLQIHGQGGGPSPFASIMPGWVQSAFNIGPNSMTELNGFMSVCLQHPFLLTVLLAMPITLLTAWLTGDIEKRAIALVLSRPIGRFHIMGAIFFTVIFWCALAVVCAWGGCLVGADWVGLTADLNKSGLAHVILNLACLVFAFTGIAALVSSMLSVRGDAVGWCLTIVLIMYVWNFLAQIWYGGGGFSNYSLFRFYRPTQVLMQSQSALVHIEVLGGIGLAGWIVGAIVYRLRSFSV